MVEDRNNLPKTSAGALVTGILGDLQLLVEQQFQLTRCEIEQELRQRAAATAVYGAGMAGYFLSALMLSLSAAHSLHWALNPTFSDSAKLPLWACEGAVAFVLLCIGTLLVHLGRIQLRAVTKCQNPTTSLLQNAKQWKIGPR